MVSRGRARQGGYGNVCLVETSCVMAWSGGHGALGQSLLSLVKAS